MRVIAREEPDKGRVWGRWDAVFDRTSWDAVFDRKICLAADRGRCRRNHRFVVLPGAGSPTTLGLGAEQLYTSPDSLGVEVTEMPAAARVELGGYVEARDVVRLTAQAPGRIVYTAGQEGDRVGAGQVVASLDDDALRPEYRAAWANLTSETVASENAQTQLYHRLYGQQTTSPMGGPAYDAYDRTVTPFYNMAQSFMGGMMPGASATPYSPVGGSNMPLMTQQQSQRSYPAINNARADYERQLAGLVGSQSHLDELDAKARDRRATTPRAGVIPPVRAPRRCCAARPADRRHRRRRRARRSARGPGRASRTGEAQRSRPGYHQRRQSLGDSQTGSIPRPKAPSGPSP